MERNQSVALVVGPGPVTPSQGTWPKWHAARLCIILRRLGHRALALEDDPSTLMDLYEAGDGLYIEPALPEVVEAIVERRGVNSVWYGAGGRRGGILAARLSDDGFHQRLGVATPDWDDRAWWTCGDRTLLREALEAEGIANPRSYAVRDLGEALEASRALGFPLVARPHFSTGGAGAGLAYNREDYRCLVEEAAKESLTGELLVEEALEGWTKYVVVVLRDAWGGSRVAGILEQLSPVTFHEGDAVMMTPPRCAGGDGAYALGETAVRVAEVVSATGACEVKLAAAPGWEEINVLDVNPVAREALVPLETLLGRDILEAHVRLAMGADIAAAAGDGRAWDSASCLVMVPAYPRTRGREEEGYLSMARHSWGRRVFVGASPARAATEALRFISAWRSQGRKEAPCDSLAVDRLLELAEEEGRGFGTEAGVRAASAPLSVARPAGGFMEGGLLFLGGSGGELDGGHEKAADCVRALHAIGERGYGTAFYTPDPGLAMLAAAVADAVFLGEMEPPSVAEAAAALGLRSIVAHLGGTEALRCSRELQGMEMAVEGMEAIEDGLQPAAVLERLKSAGIPVTAFHVTGIGADVKVDGRKFPLHATPLAHYGREASRLVFTPEEARELARAAGGAVLWRTPNEDAQEIQVELVASTTGIVAGVIWEELDTAGVSPGDGVAVYPPVSLTTDQGRCAMELARRAVEVLGWKGNLSLRVVDCGEGMGIWGAEPGGSENLAFLERASGIPLVRMGILALLGEGFDVDEGTVTRVSVRFPLQPERFMTETDILPSSKRKATGAVMGTASDYGTAIGKALLSLGMRPRRGGNALLSVANREKRKAVLLARELVEGGYRILATRGTAHTLSAAGIEVETVNKLREGRPNILDLIRNGEVSLVVNIPRGRYPHCDGFYIREASVRHGVPCLTDMEVAMALAVGLRHAASQELEPRALSEYVPAGEKLKGH